MANFEAFIKAFHERDNALAAAAERAGFLRASSASDPGYQILLTRGTESAWRVTSFRDGVPTGHREYDRLAGGGPTQNAVAEFVGFIVEQVP